MTVRDFKPGETCRVNGYLVEVYRHARRTTFVRAIDPRLPGESVVQLDKACRAKAAT